MKKVVSYIGYCILVLVVCDGLFMVCGWFPPKRTYGSATLGFPEEYEGAARRIVYQSVHWRFTQSDSGVIVKNADGTRTRRTPDEILAHPPGILLAVGGDSQTGLPYKNELTHPFVLEQVLQNMGFNAEVDNGAQGGYSPLQAYLFFNEHIAKLKPAVFLLNLYTGNDLFDMMRYDDRPHYEQEGGSRFVMKPPVWFRYADPGMKNTLVGKSRVWFVVESLAREVGLWNAASRVSYLSSMAKQNGGTFMKVLAYLRAVSHSEEDSLMYPPAYSAQILNQYLFFKYFPSAKAESLKRLAYLVSCMKTEHPSLRFVMSPIPSAALTGELKSDRVFSRKLDELGIDYDSLRAQEGQLYDSVCAISHRYGFFVIDNRPALDETRSSLRAYMNEDLHLSPAGSRALGENEGRELSKVFQGISK